MELVDVNVVATLCVLVAFASASHYINGLCNLANNAVVMQSSSDACGGAFGEVSRLRRSARLDLGPFSNPYNTIRSALAVDPVLYGIKVSILTMPLTRRLNSLNSLSGFAC